MIMQIEMTKMTKTGVSMAATLTGERLVTAIKLRAASGD
jgi:hypothetical protein